MNKEKQMFRDLLKDHGCFVTKSRLELFRILQNQPALSMKEIVALHNHTDQATVYRNVALFEKLGIIKRLQLGWKFKLELSDKFQHHHHHLTCNSCHKVIALSEDETLEVYLHNLAKQHGFVSTDHQLEISGVCPSCQK